MSIVLEAVTMVKDALADNAIGVNAQLAATTLIAGDTALPADVAFFGDEFRDDEVAQREPPRDLPAIYVTRDGPLVMQGEVATAYRDAKVPYPVAIRIFTEYTNGVKANRYNEYYGQAIVRSLKQFLDNTEHALRTRNGINLIAAEEILWTPWREEVGGAMITGVVSVTVYMRDNQP